MSTSEEEERIQDIKSILQSIRSATFIENYYLLMKLFELGHADWLIARLEYYKCIAHERGN